MNDTQTINRSFARVGWGALFIWWGVVIVIDPLTIGMGAIGTGLILIGVNVVRTMKGVPTKDKASTTAFGIIALVWGALDTALRLNFGASFATLLIVIGLVLIASLLVHTDNE
jgi:hypothetical protein